MVHMIGQLSRLRESVAFPGPQFPARNNLRGTSQFLKVLWRLRSLEMWLSHHPAGLSAGAVGDGDRSQAKHTGHLEMGKVSSFLLGSHAHTHCPDKALVFIQGLLLERSASIQR